MEFVDLPVCFMTVATREFEEELRNKEEKHQCVRPLLGYTHWRDLTLSKTPRGEVGSSWEVRIEEGLDPGNQFMTPSKVLAFKPRETNALPRAASIRLPVMLVGKDEELLKLRQQVLESAGFKVRSLCSDAAGMETRSPSVRVWVVCNTVPLSQIVSLAYSILRFSPRSRLLLIEGLRPVQTEACLFDRIIRRTDSVEEMLRKVSELARAA